MKKEILRNQLFDKYFEVKNGILVVDLVDTLSFIPELWKKLHILCENNIKYFDSFSDLEKFKLIDYKEKKYLILKIRMFKYVIIDIKQMENISEEQFRSEFDENFFVSNFDEIKDDRDLFRLYDLISYHGNMQELVDFYNDNKELLCLSTELHYRLQIGKAWTYFYIDFANANAQMGFQTPDQFLYEQLFLKYDLSPSRMQDAQEKIGVGRMYEMFEEIKKIIIPKEVIPDDLYQQFLIQCNRENQKLEKIKVK